MGLEAKATDKNQDFTVLATHPMFSTRDLKAVPAKYRALVPEYVKDYRFARSVCRIGGSMGRKNAMIEVQGTAVTVAAYPQGDYLSLTDMLKAKDGDFFVSDWLRNRNTVEFLCIGESVHNPDFNCGGFAAIRSRAGLNSYKLSVKEWAPSRPSEHGLNQ